MSNNYHPRVIMSIHGYLSTGKWQDELSTTLSVNGYQSAPYKYGIKSYRILSYHYNKDIRKFRDWYFNVVNSRQYDLNIAKPFHRPSIMAHSLGTFLIARALNMYPEIKFDKVFLFGSIIPANFDWYRLILNDQVDSVIYEKAKSDAVVPWSFFLTRGFKPSGLYGFVQKSSFIKEIVATKFGHSDFQYQQHFQSTLNDRLYEVPHQLSVIEGGVLDERSVVKIFKQTLQIDNTVFDQIYQQTTISIESAKRWFQMEKDIWSFVKHVFTEKILGYVNAVPVSDETFNDYVNGRLKESEIKANQILSYESCKEYNLLILSVAIKRLDDNDQVVSSTKILEMLLMSFIHKVLKNFEDGIRLKKFAALAYTDEGEKLCKGFCMTKGVNDAEGHSFYSIDLKDLRAIDYGNGNFMCRWWYKDLIKYI